ncbi:hypothetical protein A9Q84_07875 [Halobacteriovorax marinus]|uniref:Xanthine dehydrogenase accessory protein XdhC n=1 Tax=Halobacteriovorax marinus TaxID=97084 RepID=A0A1Y5F5W0_9BACT|nr:hypothetical protein A9Q84_07875 [Halobacteriovorax marinus]
MNKFSQVISDKANAGQSFCVATLVNVVGSAPQNQGARIIVSGSGDIEGTIGGGKLERFVIDKSVSLLNDTNSSKSLFLTKNLQKDIGMTCGGVVSIFFEIYNHNQWNIVVFGAGHVSQSLCRFLVKLNCNVTVIDNRAEWLEKFEDVKGLKTIHNDQMKDHVVGIPKESFVIIMTMGHGADLPILNEILAKNIRFPYLGVIGSKSKRNSIEKGLRELGVTNFDFLCPIGLNIGDNSPEEISISIMAQLLEVRDQS